jgi:hypothetical protein
MMQQQSELTVGPMLFDVFGRLLTRVKSILLISNSTQDAKLTDLIRVSLALVERYTNRLLVERQVTGRFSHAEQTVHSVYPAVHFAVAPVFRDAFVSVFWSTNVDETLTGYAMPYLDQGLVFITKEPAKAELGWDECAKYDENKKELYPIKATILAGYKGSLTTWTAPDDLQYAVASLAAYFFENPTDCGSSGCTHGSAMNGVTLPQSVAMLCNQYVIKRVY